MSTRVVLIGKHPLTVRGARSILENDFFVEIAGVSINPEEARSKILELRPDIVIIDAGPTPNTNPDFSIVGACTAAEVVALLDPQDAISARKLVDAGVQACLTKTDERLLSLSRVVHQVSQGRRVYSPAVLQFQFDHPPSLAPREIQVLRLVRRGKTNRRIARELNLSPGTVRNYLSSIYNKLEIPIGEAWNR